MRITARRSSVISPSPRRLLAGCVVLAGLVVLGCGGSTSTARPNQSLVTLEFTPRPSATATAVASPTPGRSTLPASWPVGWDVSFCTAFADTTVAHELVIDIDRALADDSRSDAQGLADELARTAPIATSEVNRLKDWPPANELKSDLLAVLDLDSRAADAYRSYFRDDVRSALRQARQLRTQVGKQVGPINEQLQQLANLGVDCPGADLKLETL